MKVFILDTFSPNDGEHYVMKTYATVCYFSVWAFAAAQFLLSSLNIVLAFHYIFFALVWKSK